MSVDITIPRLGTVKSDATVLEWKIKEGEPLEKGKPVLVVETDKIKSDVEAETTGFLHIIVSEGVKCPVATVVGVIATNKEELVSVQQQFPAIATPSANKEATSAAKAPVSTPVQSRAESIERIRISPVARKMAEENVIDISKVIGTGPDGRIVREDIEKAIASKASAPPSPISAEKAPEPEIPGEKRIKYTLPLRGMRGAIAEHMHRSLMESAQLSAMGEIDMTELVKIRKDFVARENPLGTRITYNDIFVYVLAKVLKEKPIVNSSIIGNEVKVWDDINIGVAVSIDEGLIVPVIKNADRISIVEISKISKVLVEKARTGKLTPDDVTGGTFTITNLGAAGAGWRFETSIINSPESAILGIGGITDRAVVRDGQIVIRPIMTYGFTYDHRVIDGTNAVQFMARVIELLETPSLLLL